MEMTVCYKPDMLPNSRLLRRRSWRKGSVPVCPEEEPGILRSSQSEEESAGGRPETGGWGCGREPEGGL